MDAVPSPLAPSASPPAPLCSPLAAPAPSKATFSSSYSTSAEQRRDPSGVNLGKKAGSLSYLPAYLLIYLSTPSYPLPLSPSLLPPFSLHPLTVSFLLFLPIAVIQSSALCLSISLSLPLLLLPSLSPLHLSVSLISRSFDSSPFPRTPLAPTWLHLPALTRVSVSFPSLFAALSFSSFRFLFLTTFPFVLSSFFPRF